MYDVQMGKFYELFHMDAVISVSHLGLIYMKVESCVICELKYMKLSLLHVPT